MSLYSHSKELRIPNVKEESCVDLIILSCSGWLLPWFLDQDWPIQDSLSEKWDFSNFSELTWNKSSVFLSALTVFQLKLSGYCHYYYFSIFFFLFFSSDSYTIIITKWRVCFFQDGLHNALLFKRIKRVFWMNHFILPWVLI